MRRVWAVSAFAAAVGISIHLLPKARVQPPASAITYSLEGTVAGGRAALGGIAISPDGQQLAYIASDGRNAVLPRNQAPPRYIWLKPVGGGTARVLPITDLPSGIFDLAFSPDGQSLAFRASGGLSCVSVRGGRTTTICQACQAQNAYGLSWGADDRIADAGGEREGVPLGYQ